MKLYFALIFISITAFAQTKTVAKPASEKKLTADDSSARRQFSDEELQQKFFNNKTLTAKTNTDQAQIFLPVFYERMEHPLARIQSRITNKIVGLVGLEIDGSAMLAILKEVVADPWITKRLQTPLTCLPTSPATESVANKNENVKTCWVKFETFNDPEVKIEFNEKMLEVRLHVPAALRTKKITSLLRYGSFSSGEPTNLPNWLSSYVNVNLSQTFRSDAVELQNGREPLIGYYNSGTRMGDLVIEANARSAEKRREIQTTEPAFVREDVRGVLDFPSSANRAQIGDLNYPVRSFQTFRPMAGATLFTQQSLQTSLLTAPTGSYEIYLLRPSKITVYINEQLIQTIALPAGHHNLRDFPFGIGLNDLRLEITDDLGNTEIKSYSYFSDSQLLKLGENEISYSAGAPWTEVDGERIYDSKQTTFSAFHRYGFMQNLSLGANVQTDPYQTLAGLEILFSTKIGFFSIEPAYSINQDQPEGYAARLRYIIQDTTLKENSNRLTTFEVSSFSEHFAQLGVRNPVNPSSAKIQVNHSRALSKSANLNAGLGYNFNRQITPESVDSYTISIGAAKRWFDGFSTNINFRHSKSSVGKEEISTLLYLVWAFTKERQFVTASSESASNISRADWTYQPTTGVGGVSSRVNLQNKPTGGSYGQSLDYNGNRGRLSESYQVELVKEDLSQTPPLKQRSIHVTSLQLASAIVYAGGHFSISRPVSDSFVMFVPLENVREQNVLVNQQKDGTYISETDGLGAAVVPELSSYSMTSLVLNLNKSSGGGSLPQDHFNLNPAYHSGYAITIGTDATVYLKTKLLNADETPVAMVAGVAYFVDDLSKEPVTIFTNRAGLVRSEGFRPGRYRLEISESNYEPVEFTIPESKEDEFELPTLHLKVRK